jgi:hypothetical protein
MFQIASDGFNVRTNTASQSQSPSGLRCWSAACSVLASRAKIPLRSWMLLCCVLFVVFVVLCVVCCCVLCLLCVVCCVRSAASVTSWSLVQRSPTECVYLWSRYLKESARVGKKRHKVSLIKLYRDTTSRLRVPVTDCLRNPSHSIFWIISRHCDLPLCPPTAA